MMKNLKKWGLVAAMSLTSTVVFAQAPVKRPLPFSNYLSSGNLVFVSGQIGTSTLKVAEQSFNEEVHAAIKNVSAVLEDAGLSLQNTVSVTVYLKSLAQFEVFNQVYLGYFKAPFPARTCVVVKDLVQHANIEISVIASRKSY